MTAPINKPIRIFSISKYAAEKRVLKEDQVVVEEPLQIILCGETEKKSFESILTITMRTPGNDQQLAIGLLLSEGIISSKKDIQSFEAVENQLSVYLSPGISPELDKINRFQISQSSCGICGKTSLAALEILNPPQIPEMDHFLQPEIIKNLPQSLKPHQKLFHQCGGIHASALFDKTGKFIHCCEDIGRHNALDKLLGHLCTQNHAKNGTDIIVLSGRASFELVQKCIMGGYAVIVAVGAPSSLAIQAAQRFNITLCGFVSEQAFNVYTGEWRLKVPK